MNDTDYTPRGAPLTGRKVLLIGLSGFAIVMAANIAMVVSATGTFPGLVVKNSYVESQRFNDRIAAARDQAALGWTTTVDAAQDGLYLVIENRAGEPVSGLVISGAVRRPSDGRTVQELSFSADGAGYRAAADLAPGIWSLEAEAHGDAPVHRIEARIRIRE